MTATPERLAQLALDKLIREGKAGTALDALVMEFGDCPSCECVGDCRACQRAALEKEVEPR